MASYLSGFEHLEFQLEEIKTATNNFDDSNVIGTGGFGKVYKGELTLPEGKQMAAFKRLDRKHGQGDPEFFKEIRMLSSYKHDNLISLLGFCKEGDEMILIYEHASQGSLDRILNKATLTWAQRLKICLDAAKGLCFLHDPKGTQQRVLHCDIKSANILLDESLNAKVADFGLSKISPANQQFTLLVTSPVGTPGYCDPLYMYTYKLTKESDVYSFGVVLFEVLCGRVCYENSNGKLKIFVPYWNKCYEQKKLDEIIFPHLKQQMDPSSVEQFVDIAYQCLQETREERPTMSVVVEKLETALELQEQEPMRMAAEQEYKEILKCADPPLRFLEFPVNGGKTLLSINHKGEVICERIYIEACLNLNQCDRLQDPSEFENLRFPGGRCYCKHKEKLNVRVRARFLYPLITYSLNIVFRNVGINMLKTVYFKLNGEKKCCIVYDTYEREDGWFVVPLYQFTSDHKIAHFEISIDIFGSGYCKLQVAGFEFQPLEEKVELHDQGLEEYQDIAKAASQPLFYKSLEEFKVLLTKGFHINNYKTWFSLNENGEHCVMLSISQCLIASEGGVSSNNYSDVYSRFPSFHYIEDKRFRVHIRSQYLTPSIIYTVNLVLNKGDQPLKKKKYVALRYKLEGERETSIVYLANETKDKRSFIAELYQFTSDGRVFDLKIVFKGHKAGLKVEGILFQPLEKVEHEQVLKDEKLSNDSLQWTMKEKDLGKKLLKWFYGDKEGQEGYAVDRDGKKSLMLSARGVITSSGLSFQASSESRFGEVAVLSDLSENKDKQIYFEIKKEINSDVLSPETTYASYLIYKLPQFQSQSEFKGLLEITYCKRYDVECPYIYLFSPQTPIIRQKLDQNTHNQPLNRPKLDDVPRQRKDGWMEVKLIQFETPSSTETDYMHLYIGSPNFNGIGGLTIESIEFRPIVSHSV